MRNKKYLRKLSKKERRQFRLNFDSDGDFRYYMKWEIVDDFTFFITSGFYWDVSNEGYDYWRSIANRGNYKI